MNSKKNKGKSKSNKPPNPNTLQKVEESSKDVENIEEVSVGDIDSAQKSDLRVPEIISEVITPAVDVKDKEDDSPKKPKRNRGKKKKNDKDDDEIQDVKPVESVDVIEIVEVETQEIIIEENVSPNVAPSARKKKNKNTKGENLETKGTEKIEKDVAVTERTEKVPDTELGVIDEIKSQDFASQEIKTSKKKNKKKKRNDSEKSEKIDEISCTAAFDKLLTDDKTEVKTTENQPTEEIKAETVTGILESEGKDLNITSVADVEPLDLKSSTQNLSKNISHEPSSKNKKNKKKDKKEPPKEKEAKELIESTTDMPEMVPITDFEVMQTTNVQETVSKEKPIEELVCIESKSPVEDMKPKAKIAKPVERKRKDKEDIPIQDVMKDSAAQEQVLQSVFDLPQEKISLVTLEEMKTDIKESRLAFNETKDDKQEALGEASILKDTTSENKSEFIDLPQVDKNKKRKKSPKPGKLEQKCKPAQSEVTKEEILPPVIIPAEITVTQPAKEVQSHDAAITQAFEELIRIPESDKSKKRKKSPKPSKLEQKATMLQEATVESVMEPIVSQQDTKPSVEETHQEEVITPLLASEIVKPQKEPAREEASLPLAEIPKQELLAEKEEIKMKPKEPDTKSKKKSKKSPKLPQGSDTFSETKNTSTPSESMSAKQEMRSEDPKSQSSEEISHGKTDIFYDMPSTEDIEIRSLKADESEGSTCGFTPDIIQHPRATSQDLIDGNNNMLIQEITVDEVKLQIPTDIPDTPFIQGSGETPLNPPETIFVGVQITEMNVEGSKTEPEKTDIKSKMMEVNQDMEELRLSIERSLAELTAIEKNEGEIEQKFEEKACFTPDAPKSPEVKISMPSELIFKSQSEKTEKAKDKNIDESCAPPILDIKLDESCTLMTLLSEELKKKDVSSKPLEHSIAATDIPKAAEKISDTIVPPIPPARKDKSMSKERDIKNIPLKPSEDVSETVTEVPIQPETTADSSTPPVIPARKDHKNKGKNKKKGKQEAAQTVSQTESTSSSTESKQPTQESKKDEKPEQKSDTKQDKGKKHSDNIQTDDAKAPHQQEDQSSLPDFNPIENFEDAMTSSADDINKTFEMIASEASQIQFTDASHVNPEIKIVAPIEDTKPDKKDDKVNPVSPPKNLLGHPDIPVPSNRTDYKKEKNKAPNTITAKVKIKDAVLIDGKKQTKDTQTDNIRKFMKNKSIDESFSSVTNENDEFVYKYSFRKVYLQTACHVCKKELKQARVPCNFCNLIFYCNAKHKDEDWTKHQGFCFAVSTIVHLKDQKYIYADSKNITGQDYRLLRMQMIVSCEKVLKRKLTPFEQEALLYPRVCANAACREWRQNKLVDCDGCGQISYCSDHPDHFPKSHQRWCKSYALYQKLVCYQQTRGRLEPKLPSRIMEQQMPEKMNEVLAAMYEEKIDMNDIQYAALTQIATAPLTAAYCLQAYAKLANHTNGTYKKTTCTIHVVGGELQFEADALNKWEVFFLHLRPDLQELRVVMIGRDLNPSNLPLELLGKVKLCESCRADKRRVVFSFQDKTTYHDYWASDDFVAPDIVCTFNPSIKRSSMYNGKDPWPKTINCILKLKTPFVITAYTMSELQKDLDRIKDCSEIELKTIIEPKSNSFASVRPDRNFISDDEMPLLFKNYCYTLVVGAN